MRKNLRAAAAALSCLAALAAVASWQGCAGRGSWVGVSPTGEGFSVMMPAAPETHGREISNGSAAAATINLLLARDGGVEYAVAYTSKLPERVVRSNDADNLLGRLAKNMLNSARRAGKGDVKFDGVSEISLNGHRGRQYEFNSESFSATLRAYLVGQRFLVLCVSGPKEEFAGAQVKRFYDSFVLLWE